ncbi:MAG TPA: hypothetical protein VKX25_02205 [Bryobacteraceae bacterium]|nr:hypothetical protein [Bryobacteraceae bacterium]
MSNSSAPGAPEPDWPRNYFNYFTEAEEHFQRARGTGLFLLSPLDWALLENWKNAGVPLEAVLKGIDAAFEKWRSRKQKRRHINSIAYCTQAVMEAAQRTPAREHPSQVEAPFEAEQLQAHLQTAAAALRQSDSLAAIAASLDELAPNAAEYLNNLEELERRLTALEEKMVAIVRASQTDAELYALRTSLEAELKPYRGKMSADQISMLERRYLDSALLARANLPRLSLFYLH